MRRLSSFALSLVMCVACAAGSGEPSLLIGAFNVQVFGDSKSSKPAVMQRLVRIIRRYDIILVQEVRDKDGSAAAKLLSDINDGAESSGVRGEAFKLLLGERLGRSNSKEQYAWFYRDARVRPINASVDAVPDPRDVWEREPMLVYWDTRPQSSLTLTSSFSEDPASVDPTHIFATLGIHVDPDDAVREIDELVGPVDKALADGLAGLGVLVLGDLNADCSYLTKTEWKCIREDTCSTTQMRLWDPNKYVWLLNDTVDTTTSNSDCAYDRFVYAPPAPCANEMCSDRISGVGVYNFQREFSLSQEDAKEVSDHFPIELRIHLDSKNNRDDEKTSEGQRRWTFVYAVAVVFIATIVLHVKGHAICVIELQGDFH